MAATQNILFSWDNVEALPDLQRLELVFRYLPDQDIIAALQQMRGHGRNDFPVATMWRALLAGVVFQHESIESLLRELRRNPALLTLCEFDPVPLQSPPKKVLERVDGVLRVDFMSQPQRSTIPDSHNFSRFLKLVVQMEQKQGLIAAKWCQRITRAIDGCCCRTLVNTWGMTVRLFRVMLPGARIRRPGKPLTRMRTGASTKPREYRRTASHGTR